MAHHQVCAVLGLEPHSGMLGEHSSDELHSQPMPSAFHMFVHSLRLLLRLIQSGAPCTVPCKCASVCETWWPKGFVPVRAFILSRLSLLQFIFLSP